MPAHRGRTFEVGTSYNRQRNSTLRPPHSNASTLRMPASSVQCQPLPTCWAHCSVFIQLLCPSDLMSGLWLRKDLRVWGGIQISLVQEFPSSCLCTAPHGNAKIFAMYSNIEVFDPFFHNLKMKRDHQFMEFICDLVFAVAPCFVKCFPPWVVAIRNRLDCGSERSICRSPN